MQLFYLLQGISPPLHYTPSPPFPTSPQAKKKKSQLTNKQTERHDPNLPPQNPNLNPLPHNTTHPPINLHLWSQIPTTHLLPHLRRRHLAPKEQARRSGALQERGSRGSGSEAMGGEIAR